MKVYCRLRVQSLPHLTVDLETMPYQRREIGDIPPRKRQVVPSNKLLDEDAPVL